MFLNSRIGFAVMICLGALAAEPVASAIDPRATAPYLDHSTAAVVGIDVERVDLAAMQKLFTEMITAWDLPADERQRMLEEAEQQFWQPMRQRRQTLLDSGAKQLFLIFNLQDLTPAPTWIIVPLAPGSDAKRIAGLFDAQFGEAAAATPAGRAHWTAALPRPDTLLIAQGAAMQRLAALGPVPRPEVASAFESAGDAWVVAALVPPAGSLEALQTALPELPPEMGGGATATLTQGLRWGFAWLDLSRAPAFSLQLISRDEPSAMALAKWARQRLSEAAAQAPEIAPAFQAIRPSAQRDRMIVELSLDELKAIAGPAAGKALTEARAAARMKASMSNIRQLLLAVIMFHDDMKRYPDTLEETKKYLPAEAVFVNPRDPDRRPGYIYLKPTAPPDPQTAVVYESHDRWPQRGICVGFVDGHVEVVAAEDAFRELLARQAAAAPGAQTK